MWRGRGCEDPVPKTTGKPPLGSGVQRPKAQREAKPPLGKMLGAFKYEYEVTAVGAEVMKGFSRAFNVLRRGENHEQNWSEEWGEVVWPSWALNVALGCSVVWGFVVTCGLWSDK